MSVASPSPATSEPQIAVAPGFPDGAPSGDAPRPRSRRLLRRLLPFLLGVVVLAGAIGFYLYQQSQLYVSTENAQITGNLITVGNLEAGRISSINTTLGANVSAGSDLADVELPTQTGTTTSGTPEMSFLGGSDAHVAVTAPISGVVIGVPGAVGAMVAAGQTIVTLVDPSQLWVSANFDETNVGRLRVGQSASVHIDALNTDVPGRVQAITPATLATFSSLPDTTTSGDFNKVVQWVPVQIAVSLGNEPTLVGASVEVSVRVG